MPLSRRARLWLAAAALAVATAWVYSPVLEYGTVGFDDPIYLEDNPQVLRGLSWQGLAWALSTGYASNWHPLTWLSHMLDVELFGAAWGAHHGVSVALHLLSALLLLLFLENATGRLAPAAFVAALFALHPLHVESVAWLSERKDVLSTLLWWAALLAYLRWCRRPSGGRYALVAGLFALGLTAKPMLVTLPFTLLLLDFWPLGRWNPVRSAAAGGWRGLRPRLVEKLPLFALALASALVTLLVQRAGGAVSGLAGVPLGERLANAAVAYAAYLGNALWPVQLAVYYPHRGMPAPGPLLGSLLLLAALTALALAASGRRPWWTVGWLWYLGTLVPVIGLVQVGGQALADRYTYVPLVGIFLAVAYGLAEPWATAPAPEGSGARLRGPGSWLRESGSRLSVPAVRRAGALLAVVVVLLAAVAARRQVAVWRDSETLFRHALEVTGDNALMANLLGATLLEKGEAEAALPYLERSAELDPSSAEVFNNLGVAAQRRGAWREAVERFRAALERDPGHLAARVNLAGALVETGRPEEALAQVRRALEAKPRDATALHDLGLTLAQLGRPEEAAERFRAALALDPARPRLEGDLANALVQSGRPEEALEHYRRALERDAGDLAVRSNRAQALALAGRLGEARAEYRALLAARPGDARGHFFLGLVELAAGDEGAVREQAARLDGLDPSLAAELRRRAGL